MKFLSSLTSSDADPGEDHIDALFEFSLEALTVSAGGFEPTGTAGVCVGDVTVDEVQDTISELDSYFTDEDERENPETEFRRDDRYFGWVVFHTDAFNFDRIVDAMNFVLRTIMDDNTADSVVAVLYEVETPAEQSAYIVYSPRNAGYYPFAPSPTRAQIRDTELEGEVHKVLEDAGIPLVEDKDSWHPMWPPEPGRKPWEKTETTADETE